MSALPLPPLELNRDGYWEIRTCGADRRTRTVSMRTKHLAVAEVARRAWLAAQAAGDAGTGTGTGVGRVLAAYHRDARGRGVVGSFLACIDAVARVFGGYEVRDVGHEAVGEYITRRTGQGARSGTVRRELSALSAGLRWGVRVGLVDKADVVDFTLPAAGAVRVRWLDEAEEQRLWALASGEFSRIGLFICVALETGARKAAIEGLTWDRVDLARRVIDFRDPGVRVSKKRRVATVITDRLAPVLERERSARTGFVLGTDKDVRGEWDGFMAAHGFAGITPHVLRHTRTTLLLRAGVSVWDAGALVGTSPEMVERVYGHHAMDGRLRAIANKRSAESHG